MKYTTDDVLTLFRTGIPNNITRKKYEDKIKELVCSVLEDYLDGNIELRENQRKSRLDDGNVKKISAILDADFGIRVNEFVSKAKSDPNEIMNVLLTYAEKLKQRCDKPTSDPDHLKPQTLPNYFKPIKKLFKMNGVHFEWSRIDVTLPEPLTNHNSRGYTRDEIQKLIKFSNPMEQAVIYIASSSGIRRGAFDLMWNCIKPIYRRNNELVMGEFDDSDDSEIVCGMLTVYAGTNDQYFGLFSIEAWNSIKNYKTQWVSELLKHPKPDDKFLKKVGSMKISLSCDALANRLNKVLKKSKLREALTDGNRNHDVPVMNGFRRFFDKVTSESFTRESSLGSLIKRERLMGHNGLIKLDKNYFKTHWKELVEEYLEIVPSLIISPEERLKADNNRLRKEKSELETTKQELEELKRDVRIIKKYSNLYNNKKNI